MQQGSLGEVADQVNGSVYVDSERKRERSNLNLEYDEPHLVF